jgi:hypothetical protein
MKGKANEIYGKLAGASLRGKRTPGTSRDLWQSNSYDSFQSRFVAGVQPVRANPAQTRLQPSCLAMFAEEATSAFTRTRPH